MKKKILIVDDETNLAKMIAMRLQTQNFEVITAFSGKTGIEKALKEKPDLILMDILMPTMDGYEAVRRLKEMPETKDIYVIMFSNINEQEGRRDAMKYGADDYVNKSVHLDQLIQKLRVLLYES